MIYRKRPVTVEAFQLGVDVPQPEWFVNAITNGIVELNEDRCGRVCAQIWTLEGVHHASFGDYIIKGVANELYPCKPDIFRATYEKVED